MYQIKAGERETRQKSVSLPPKAGGITEINPIFKQGFLAQKHTTRAYKTLLSPYFEIRK